MYVSGYQHCLKRHINPQPQAEKSTIALYKHHPELKDIWGDVENGIAIVKPKKADQPANLKVTLLPFQQESLHWMREQEKGIWCGGMLAVRNHFPLDKDASDELLPCRMRWGMHSSISAGRYAND